MTSPKKKEDSFLDKIGTLARKKKAKEGRENLCHSPILILSFCDEYVLSRFFGIFDVGVSTQHSKYGRALKKYLSYFVVLKIFFNTLL